jgi:hypothetical protein
MLFIRKTILYVPGRDELKNTPTTNTGDSQQRVQSINRQQLYETICRLAKPKSFPMAQSMQINSSVSSNSIPLSQSSHQLRSSTPPVTMHHPLTSSSTFATSRRVCHVSCVWQTCRQCIERYSVSF